MLQFNCYFAQLCLLFYCITACLMQACLVLYNLKLHFNWDAPLQFRVLIFTSCFAARCYKHPTSRPLSKRSLHKRGMWHMLGTQSHLPLYSSSFLTSSLSLPSTAVQKTYIISKEKPQFSHSPAPPSLRIKTQHGRQSCKKMSFLCKSPHLIQFHSDC